MNSQNDRAAAVCLAAAIFGGLPGETLAQDSQESKALIAALHDGYEQWFQDSNFKATYTVRRGVASEDGAKFASGKTPIVVETGELVKMGPAIRRRGMPTEAVMVHVLSGDATRTQGFIPYDEARAGKVAVEYLAFPEDRGLPAGPYASITMTSLLDVEEGVAVGAGRVFSPANFRLVGPGPNPIPGALPRKLYTRRCGSGRRGRDRGHARRVRPRRHFGPRRREAGGALRSVRRCVPRPAGGRSSWAAR